MLRKVLAVFPVFILFAFSGLFVFASPSAPVVFEVQRQDLTTAEKQDRTWDWIKSELRDNYTYLDFADSLKPLLDAAHNDDYNKKGSELEQEVKIWLSLIFVAAKENKKGALAFLLQSQSLTLEQQKSRWNSLVDAGVGEQQDALLNPKYAYLVKTPISIKKGEKVYKVNLEPLFLAAKRFGVVKTGEEFSKIKIPGFREMIWDFYFLSSVGEREINAALTTADDKNKPKLNNLWSGIKDELKKPEYAHLSKNPIPINNKNYDLEPLFKVAQSSFTGNGYDLDLAAKMQLQDLVNAGIDAQKLKDALDVKNNENLNTLWTGIKDELKKPEYAHLSKTLINIGGTEYDLAPLFAAAKDDTQYAKKGSELPVQAKKKLQELVNDIVTAQNVKDALGVKNNENLNTLWSGIKDELKKLEYAYLSKTLINIGGTEYDLAPLFAAAKDDTQYAKKGSELPVQAKKKLQELVNDIVTAQNVKDALGVKNNENLNTLWSGIKDELKKLEYAYLSKTLINIGGTEYDLAPLFAAAKDDTQYAKKGSELSAQAKDKLQELVNDIVAVQNVKDALGVKNNENLNTLWSGIKDELKKLEYAYLSKTLINIGGTDYNLEFLFTTAKDDTQYAKKGSELPVQAKKKLQELVNDIVTAQNVKDALDVKNNENLNALWSGIKDELKKSEYAYLAETAITVDGTDYNLGSLFAAAEYYAQYEKKGSELPARAKNKLQSLVNAGVQHQIFKASLTKANIQKNQKLDDLWTQVKKILNQPEFSKLKNTSIKIKNKNYDLELLFAAAKKKVGVKDSAFSLDAKLQLQKFLNDQVTSKMIENQLLALKQAEAAKNQWIKEIQQRQLLTTGLVTGGVLLVAAGLGGFYWFFKIRK